MHAGKMYEWEEWGEQAEKTPDLSPNELGLIPLCCPNRLSPQGRKCSAKVFDAPQKRRLKGITYRRIVCLLCGHEDWRKIGLKSE